MTTKTAKNFTHYLKLGLTILFSGIALFFAFLAKDIIAIFLLASILAITIHPAVKWSESKNIPGVLAITIIYLIVGSILVLLFAQLVPVIITRVSQLLRDIPGALEHVSAGLASLPIEHNAKLLLKEQFQSSLADTSKILTTAAVDLTKNTITLLGVMLFVFFVSGYLALDSKGIRKSFLEFFPGEHKSTVSKKIDVLYTAVFSAFYGKIVVSAILAITIFIGLWILGVDRFLSLAALAFFLDFIPFIGSTIATIIGVIFGFSQSVFIGIAVLILYGVGNLIEANITTPLFIGKEAKLHPVLVLLVIGIGASIWGILGIIISIPIAAGVWALVKE